MDKLKNSYSRLKKQKINSEITISTLLDECKEHENKMLQFSPLQASVVDQKIYEQHLRNFTRTMNTIDKEQKQLDRIENELQIIRFCYKCISTPNVQTHIDEFQQYLKQYENCESIKDYIQKYKTRLLEMDELYSNISSSVNVDEFQTKIESAKEDTFCSEVDMFATTLTTLSIPEIIPLSIDIQNPEAVKSFVNTNIQAFLF